MMAEEFKDGLEHLPLPERVALRAEALADLAAKVTGVDTGRSEAERRVANLEARVGELNQTIGDLRAGWRDADQQHARDVELLLWLHAEAAWQRDGVRVIADHFAVELGRLRREVATPAPRSSRPSAAEQNAALREQLEEDALSECDGGFACPASRHVEGCFVDDVGSVSVHPEGGTA